MIRFRVFDNGTPATAIALEGAHLVGNDNVPVRSEIRQKGGELICESNYRGPAALALMWPVKGFGRIMLETTRLVERNEPYNLHVELARGRLMRISQKREDWGLFDFPDGESLYKEVEAARDAFVSALTAPDEATAARRGDEALTASVLAGARLGLFHADVFLKRRRGSGQIGRRPFGCGVNLKQIREPTVKRLADCVDFVAAPFRWRDIEPREGEHDWKPLENAIRLIRAQKLAIRGVSLVSFDKAHLPDWTYLWEGDYDQVRECLTRHLKRVLTRFGGHVNAWEVVNGVHVHNSLQFSFEQLMDLTRMAAMLSKQLSPRSAALIGVTLPWGEYYAADQRSIPPLLYADMVVRNGINFDAFNLELRFGQGDKEQFVRDPFQISALLDVFGNFAKPIHVTVVGASDVGGPIGGKSAEAQASWLRALYRIALSKPFVETVTWHALVDDDASRETGGLLKADLTPKTTFQELQSFRAEILGGGKPSGRRTP